MINGPEGSFRIREFIRSGFYLVLRFASGYFFSGDRLAKIDKLL